MKYAKFSRTPLSKTICELLLLFSVTILYYTFRSLTDLHLQTKLYLQLDSRNLVSLVAIIYIVCRQFFLKKTTCLASLHAEVRLRIRRYLVGPYYTGLKLTPTSSTHALTGVIFQMFTVKLS